MASKYEWYNLNFSFLKERNKIKKEINLAISTHTLSNASAFDNGKLIYFIEIY